MIVCVSSLLLSAACGTDITGSAAAASDVEWASLEWLGGFNQLRAEFTQPAAAEGPVVLSVTALGCYEVFVNGAKLGPGVLEPGFSTDPSKRLLYAEHDVSSLLLPGAANAVGVRLGTCKYGWMHTYCADAPAKCAGLKLQVTAQRTGARLLWTESGGGGAWTGAPSEWAADGAAYPQRALWDGARYNHSLAQPGWASPGFVPPAGAAAWLPAARIEPPIDPPLYSARAMPPIVKHGPIAPVASWRPAPGVLVLDFGANMAGYATLRLPAVTAAAAAAAEHTITVLHGEILDAPRGLVQNQYATPPHPAADCAHYGSCALQTDRYTLPGAHAAVLLEPSFTYHGFRYVQVNSSGMAGGIGGAAPIGAEQLQAWDLHTDVRTTGSFASNSSTLNGIQGAIVATVLANLHSVPTDCPTREKRGWMGDAQLSAEANVLNFDIDAVYANFLRTIGDVQVGGCTHASAASPPPDYCLNSPLATGGPAWANATAGETAVAAEAAAARPPCHLCCDATVTNKQRFGCYSPKGLAGLAPFSDASGAVPGVVPFDVVAGWPADPAWGAAAIVVPHAVWLHTGGVAGAAAAYPTMARYADFLLRHCDPADGLLKFGMLGDWNSLKSDGTPQTARLVAPRTAVPQVSAFYGILNLDMVGAVAKELGRTADAERYAGAAARMRPAYHAAFFHASNGSYATDPCSQTANILPAVLGIVPDAEKPRVWAALNASLHCYGPGTAEPTLDDGIVGARYLFAALTALGREDVALAVALKETEPSFGWMVSQGPGTLWEQWLGDAHHIGGNTSSKNHHMFAGGIGLFLYTQVAGVGTQLTAALPAAAAALLPAAAASRTVVVKPLLPVMRRVRAASATVRAPLGGGRRSVGVSWSFFGAAQRRAQRRAQQQAVLLELSVNATVGTGPASVPVLVHVPLGSPCAATVRLSQRAAPEDLTLWSAAGGAEALGGVREARDGAGRHELLVSLAAVAQGAAGGEQPRQFHFTVYAAAEVSGSGGEC